jgi:hypothetical protein
MVDSSFVPAIHYYHQPRFNSWPANSNRKYYNRSRGRNPGSGIELFWKASSVAVSNDSDVSNATDELI